MRRRSSWNCTVSKTRYSANEPPLALPSLPRSGAQPPQELLVPEDLGHLRVVHELLLPDAVQRGRLDEVRERTVLGLGRRAELAVRVLAQPQGHDPRHRAPRIRL